MVEKFPTGLPTLPVGVGIPHTDAKWVNQNSIMVGVLKKPIKMITMATVDDEIEVSIIFLLALGESNKQLNILQKIMTIIQDQELLKGIQTKDVEIVEKIVKEALLK